MTFKFLSFPRLWAIMFKELLQMKRDPTTMGMLVGIPLIQVILFGFAINNDPKTLPTALIDRDNTSLSRAFVYGMKNTGYFDFVTQPESEQKANQLLKQGQVLFNVTIPDGFEKDIIKNRDPSIKIETDATDPGATGYAIASLSQLKQNIINENLRGPLGQYRPKPAPFEIEHHARFNPLRVTQYNIVPGLLGVVLTMTMVMVTAMSITREVERGTIENLLAMPTRPLEVILGKIIPYILAGFIQVLLILLFAKLIFHLPLEGSLILLLLMCLPFIAANLAVGLFFSTIASNQLQAVQSTLFFFLPSMLLSGFLFPFQGMPIWAQYIGELFPLTHFLPIVRGIILKGNTLGDCWGELWPILLFASAAIGLSVVRYKQTLD